MIHGSVELGTKPDLAADSPLFSLVAVPYFSFAAGLPRILLLLSLLSISTLL